MRTSYLDIIAAVQRAIAENGIDMTKSAKHEPDGPLIERREISSERSAPRPVQCPSPERR